VHAGVSGDRLSAVPALVRAAAVTADAGGVDAAIGLGIGRLSAGGGGEAES
jgi:hypothetical protein